LAVVVAAANAEEVAADRPAIAKEVEPDPQDGKHAY
jgi:hypothetical protein